MSHRLQVPISETRQALERALTEGLHEADPLDRLAALGAPTVDVEQMLAEIEAGRG